MNSGNPKYVVVTTSHRGVFAGWLESRSDDEIVLTEARVCVYWSSSTRGFIGLAVTGPLSGSRVSRPAPRMVIPYTTAIIECTPDAQRQWESDQWAS